jgi:formylglycine-generating enzyme required for sulfatase activity
MKNFFLAILLMQLIFIWSKDNKHEFFYNSSILLEDFMWISKTEVSNAQYQEFLNDASNTHEYKTLLPDSSLWREKIWFSEKYETYYFRHPSYKNYPVVCVSKQQAIKYCNWLTEKINSQLITENNNPIKSIQVRLPNEWEWKYAARGGLSQWNDYPWESNSLRFPDGKLKGKVRLNFKKGIGDYMGVAGNLGDMADITGPVESYQPNGYQLYNMCGNVSEMVADNNYAYGGNWSSSGYNVRISSKIKSKAAPTIGFRYVIEVMEWKPVAKKRKELLNKGYLNSLFTRINDTLSIMNTEVTNELYNCFIRETNYKRPDSTAWDNQFWYAHQYANKYHWHPNYDQFPVVNISIKDVEVFASWLTGKYVEYSNIQHEIRLPYEDEWMLAARLKNNVNSYYPWGGPYVRDAKGCFLCNYRTCPEIYTSEDEQGNVTYNIPKDSNPMLGSDLDGFSYVSPVNAYTENENELYNMSGNVAEMIYNKDYTKGGSWKSDRDEITINSREVYISNSPTVGFRLAIKH